MGDLFAYWYEHPKVDFYSKNPALKAIKNFKNKGKKVYFLYGNRDFTADKYFKKYSQVDFIGPDLTIKSGNKKILVTHGDIFAKKDIRYQIWRRFIRSKFALFVFKRLPIGSAIKIVDQAKKIGKGQPIKQKIIADIIEKGVKPWYKKGFDSIVAGHAHYRIEREYFIKGKKRELHIVPEFKFPGEFLTLEKGDFDYKQVC